MSSVTIWLLPLAFLALPVWFFSKWLERKMNPRKSGWYFLLWIASVVAISFGWYLLCLSVFLKFYPVKP